MGADPDHRTCDDVDCSTCRARELAAGRPLRTPRLERVVRVLLKKTATRRLHA